MFLLVIDVQSRFSLRQSSFGLESYDEQREKNFIIYENAYVHHAGTHNDKVKFLSQFQNRLSRNGNVNSATPNQRFKVLTVASWLTMLLTTTTTTNLCTFQTLYFTCIY